MPPVPRKHSPGAGGSRRRARRRSTRFACSSTIPDSSTLPKTGCATRCNRFRRLRGKTFRSFTSPTAFRCRWRTSDYVLQLQEVRKLVSGRLGITNDVLGYQSRSGAPGQPWLEPDILDHLRDLKARNLASAVVLAPISFISDHMEVSTTWTSRPGTLRFPALPMATGENRRRASEIHCDDS